MSSRPDLRRLLVVYAVAAGCLASAMGANALSLPLLTPTEVNVGHTGDPGPILSLVATLGGTLVGRDDALDVLVVSTTNPLSLVTTLLLRPDVRYAETNEKVWSAASGGSATRWSSLTQEATRWSTSESSATRWSGSDWEATRWSSTGWDATRWSGAGWDATRWSGAATDGSSAGFTAMDPGLPYQWGLGAVNAPGAWTQSIGTKNRIICIIDTGVDWTHPDLAKNAWTAPDGTHGYDFVNKDKVPMDDAGHGTHVAGIASATMGNGLGVAGLAQEWIMAVKVLDAKGVGKESDAAFGLRWCADNGANVASLSLGTDKDKAVLRDAVDYAASKGVLVVAAAGNEGCACKRYPAAYESVIAVGAYTRAGAKASFSNTGAWVDLAAPGDNITSTYKGNTYRVGSGTSQATPFVAAAAALAWGADTTLTAPEVSAILTSTAWDLGAAGKDPSFGHGGVDASRALAAAG